MNLRLRTLFLLCAALALVPACSSTKSEKRYSKALAAASLSRLETVGLEIGEFTIDGEDAAVDGDTIRVKGLKNSMRLIGIDTEETFKKEEERRAFAEGWEKYIKKMRGNSDRPVKMATPLGEDAKHFAQAFFKGVTKVKLERDHPGEIRDFYGRYLAYVYVHKDGQWINYNVECVRAGMSPYFSKYAFSRRFHKEFVAAQEEARAAKRGIWNPMLQHYPDYDERLKWWTARAEVISSFEKEMETHPNYFALTRWDALKRLEKMVGQEVVLLGSVSDVRLGDNGPTIVKLARTRTNDFDVVFFDKDVFLASNIGAAKGEYVRVKGMVKRYHDKYRNSDRLQMVVNAPGQVTMNDDQMSDLIAGHGSRAGAKALPEIPNKPVEKKGKKSGSLDLTDADAAGDLEFKGKEGPLELDDATKAGDLDFSSLDEANY